MEYSLNHNSWFGGKPVKITLPDAWSVTYCGMTADGCPEAHSGGYRKADKYALRKP